jgi:hypothetical protein
MGELYAVQLSAQAQGSFLFNTLAHNYRGINCQGGSAQPITDSIVSLNTDAANPLVGCTAARVVTTLGTGDLATGVVPKLLDTATTEMTCIDQAQTPMGKVKVPTDYFGTSRPLGQGYDIGFEELK